MKKKISIDLKKNINLLLFYFLTSLTLTSLFNGFETLNVFNTKWLFQGDDRSSHQIGWYFFKNDIWRFPLGANPNYGDAIGNSIIYSDSIPIFALIFKLINFILPVKFQYFSIWFTLCFFLQGILSFFLINKIIKNRQISIICSFFFLIFPPVLYRIDLHPALFGHWVLILAIIFIFEKKYNKNIYWTLLTLLTSLIHFYFTVIVLIIFNLINLFNLISKKISFKQYFLSIFICHISLIILMYIVGYFEVRVVDSLALGFGIYKLNLLSIFDSTNSHLGVSWSWLLPDLELSEGEELEGFNFPGLGILLLSFYGIYIFLSNKNLRFLINKNINKSFYISLIIFYLLSLSNNISLGKINIIQIPLTDYLYGLFSIIRSAGRLFWIISYFFLFYFIFLIYLKYKYKSLFIFLFFLIIQIGDTSSALFKRNNESYSNQIKNDFWYTKEILMFEKILTTNPVGYNSHFDKFAYYIEENNIKNTNIIKLARTDRGKVANNRYKILENFYKKNLDNSSIYVIDNIGHLLVLKEIFQNENVGFFFRDNVWIMIKDKKKLMNEKDINLFNSLIFYNLKFNKVEKAEKKDENFYIGFGWSHNNNNEGIWSEGKISNLIFKLDAKQKNINFNAQIIPFINERNKELNIDVFVNGKFNNYLEFKYDNKLSNQKNINFKIKDENILDNIINIEFKNRNPVSPYDIFLSPDSRKLGFLLLNFNFSID